MRKVVGERTDARASRESDRGEVRRQQENRKEDLRVPLVSVDDIVCVDDDAGNGDRCTFEAEEPLRQAVDHEVVGNVRRVARD